MFGAVPFSKLVTPEEQLSQKSFDGVLGLGFALMDSQVPYHKNLVLQLAFERKLKHARFSLIGPRVQPQDTSEFYDSDRKYRGSFVIGTVPREFYKGDITWCDSEVTKYRRWVVKMKSVKINDKIVCTNQLAMIDTGLSYILTGPNNLASAANKMGGTVSGRGISYPRGSLRSVEFTFGEPARTFKLTPSDLFLDVESKESSNLISSIKTTQSWSFGQDWWILGGIFLDNMVTIFDYSGDKRIGFADLSDD
jgi:Eukaryotic aspartyl protease